ncbi:hypothetical protein JCM14076_31320 [Methylosoma difficile]
MKIKGLAFILVILLGYCNAALSFNIWYEDNNLGKPDGTPVDFKEKFIHPESFLSATKYINVYMMHAEALNNIDDKFLLAYIVPFLTKNDIKLAVDVGGATFTQLNNRDKLFNREINLFIKLKKLGVKVDYISMQSILSKTPKGKVDYPLSMRIEDAVSYSNAVIKEYPQVKIGIIDALPSHGQDYKKPYLQLKEALSNVGVSLSFIHLDMPYEIPREKVKNITWQTIKEVENYVKNDLGISFGLITTSIKAGKLSDQLFHYSVLSSLKCYSAVGGNPNDWVITSWFKNPKRTIPDNQIGNVFPAMKTVKEFGETLDNLISQNKLKNESQSLHGILTTNECALKN